MATKRRKTKSRRKSRRRKSRKSCKHGKLKRPVKTKSGRKRRCKKKSRKKSKKRSKKRRKNKSRRRKRSYRFENCGVPTDLGTCLDGEDAIDMEEIDTENGNVNDYIQFGDDKRCTSRDNWNTWLRNYRQHETMAINPFTRTKTWCGANDTYPQNHNDEPKQNDSWLSEEEVDEVIRARRVEGFENCGVPTDLGTCLDGEDAISMEEIDTENGNVNDYIQFGDDKRCTSRDNWNTWLRNYRQHETMATNPFTRTKTWCGDTYPRNHNDEPKQNDSWLSEEEVDEVIRVRRLLDAAVRNDEEAVIEYLNSGGERDIFIQDHNGESLLMIAANNDNLSLVERLLQRNDTIALLRNGEGESLLMIAAREQNEALVKILIKYKRAEQLRMLNPNLQEETVIETVTRLRLHRIIALLELGETRKQTFLRAARNDNKIEIIREMLESGIDVDVQDENENTALCNASFKGSINIVKLLIRNGANVNHKNAVFNTPLIKAIATHYNPRELQRRKFEVVKELLAAGADPNPTDRFDTTPLMIAAFNGVTDVVKMLLDAGANKHLENHLGETALDFAISGNNYRTENLGQVENTEIITLLQPTSPTPAPRSPTPAPAPAPAPVPAPAPNCRQFRKTVNPKCNDQPNCNWEVGVGCRRKRAAAPAPAPAPAVATNCSQFRKTTNPKCNDQANCNWVVGSGCRRRRAAAAPAPAPAAPVTNCSQFRKTMNPKCNDQSDCKWVVGSGCKNK
jgi:ankyrin repeat protein